MTKKVLVISSVANVCALEQWLDCSDFYDIAIIQYDNEFVSPMASRAKFFLKNKDYKVINWIKLFDTFPACYEYDAYFFIDDDLIGTHGELETFFARVVQRGFDLAQPSISAGSDICWDHFEQVPHVEFAITNYVEIQCFMISKRFLRKAWPYFYMARSGFGLDLALRHLAREHNFILAIDHVHALTHPFRPDSKSVRKKIENFYEVSQTILRSYNFCFASKDDIKTLKADIWYFPIPAYPIRFFGVLLRRLIVSIKQSVRFYIKQFFATRN